MSKVTDKIAEKIAAIAPQVEDRVVETLVERQLKKRSEAMVIVLDLIDKETAALKKLRPDLELISASGQELEACYSKARWQERQKLQGKIEKMEKAIAKAIEHNEYADLYNLSSGKNPSEGGGGNPESTD